MVAWMASRAEYAAAAYGHNIAVSLPNGKRAPPGPRPGRGAPLGRGLPSVTGVTRVSGGPSSPLRRRVMAASATPDSAPEAKGWEHYYELGRRWFAEGDASAAESAFRDAIKAAESPAG